PPLRRRDAPRRAGQHRCARPGGMTRPADRRPRSRSLGGLLLAIAIPVALASALYFGTRPTCACEPIPGSPVDGIIVKVDATGLTQVNAFDLLTPRYPVGLHFI